MITRKDIKKLSSIYNIPSTVHCNKGILLDYRLVQTLENGENRVKFDQIYDFDVYLKKYDINLQRPYVWESYQQKEFIMSILLEKPLESIVVVQHNNDLSRDNTINYVIDGKQRLLTIKKFVNNEFSIDVNGEDIYWKDFDVELKMFFRTRANCITAIVYYSYDDSPITDDMKIILFNYYNFAGTPQTEDHKNKLQLLLDTQLKIGDTVKYKYEDEIIEAKILEIGNSICNDALIVDDDGGWIFPDQLIEHKR